MHNGVFGRETSFMSPQPLIPSQQSNSVPDDTTAGENSIIRNVWFDNFEDELPVISALLEKYPYIAMDTEFPGIVFDDCPEQMRNSEQRDYIKVKLNVDQMNVIQIGITLMDENG